MKTVSSPKKYRPITSRIFSGLIAGLIVGVLVGTAVAIRITQTNESLHTALLQGQLRLHMAALYACIVAILGLIVGVLTVSRRYEIKLFPHVLIMLVSVVGFYYSRNWLSVHVFTRAGEIRWVLEIIGSLLWIVVCWAGYRLLLFVETRTRGGIGWVFALLALVSITSSVYSVLKDPPQNNLSNIPPTLPAPKENVKVALFGIDGAWWEIIDPLMEAGEMPVFKSLVDRGVRSPCWTLTPTASPLIWNTIATGKNPEKHNITSFTIWTFPVTGAMLPLLVYPAVCWELDLMVSSLIDLTPINSTFRTTEALWNMLSDAGATIGIVNWWASYPAETVNGYIISDHALYDKTLQYVFGGAKIHDPRSVFPPNLFEELQPLTIDPQDIPVDSVTRFINLQSEADRAWYENTNDYRVLEAGSEAAMFKISYPEDKTMVRTAIHMLKTREQPDFFAIYLDGTDAMGHKYLAYYFNEHHRDVLKPENIQRLKNLVPNYYKYIDEELGRIINLLDPNTTIIIVSDHGFDHGIAPNGNYRHSKAPPGVFLIAGGDVKRDKTIKTASVRDITPTILTLFGLPVGRDMDGRVLTEIFELDNVPVDWVETYEYRNHQPGHAVSVQSNQAYQERLRALGYVR